MADVKPQFEYQDLLGSSKLFTGTVGTTPINIPSSPGGKIASVEVYCPKQALNRVLSFSIDDGTTYQDLEPVEGQYLQLRGGLTQIKIKGNVAGVQYQIYMNREET